MTTDDHSTDTGPQRKTNAPAGQVEGMEHGFEQALACYDEKIKPYGNVILAVIGGIAVVLLAAWYFNTQSKVRQSEAFVRLIDAKDASEVIALESRYADTPAHPYYLFEAGTRLQEEAGHDPVKLKQALRFFQTLQQRYPGQFAAELVRARAQEIESDLKWIEDELAKELAALDARRREAEEQAKTGSSGAEDGKKKDDSGQDGGSKDEPKKDESGGQEPPKDTPPKDEGKQE